MGTKNAPGKYDCFGKAADDEPVFILLGRDIAAPGTVIAWAIARLEAIKRNDRSSGDLEQIGEALHVAGAMARWRADFPRPAPGIGAQRPLDRGLLDRLINRLDEIAAWL